MAPKVTVEHLAARKNQILRAAATRIARSGFHSTTMQDIASEAELSPGALYLYFEDKASLLDALADESRSRNERCFAAVDPSQKTAALFRNVAEVFFRQFEDEEFAALVPALDMELWAEAFRNEGVREIMRASCDGTIERLESIAREAQRRGDIAKDLDPASVALVWVAVFVGYEVSRVAKPSADLWKFVEVILAMATGRFWTGQPVRRKEVAVGPLAVEGRAG